MRSSNEKKAIDGAITALEKRELAGTVMDSTVTEYEEALGASFPGMQKTINKYKDNADVKFLFIDIRGMVK